MSRILIVTVSFCACLSLSAAQNHIRRLDGSTITTTEIDSAVGVVRRVHRAGTAIVIVEHLLRVVNQLATRVVVLDRGTVLADGEPRAVMSDPAVIRAYLGRSGARA